MKSVIQLYVILTIFLFSRGAWNLFRAHSRINQRRKISDTPRAKTATAAAGSVEFEGFAWPIAAPAITIHGFRAVYHEFDLEELVGSGKTRRWVRVYSKRTSDSFYFLDGTGLVEIKPKDAELGLISSGKTSWTSLDEVTKDRVLNEIITNRVDRFPPTKLMFGLTTGTFRVSERNILVGSPLYVRGKLARWSEPVLISDIALATFSSHALDFGIGKVRNLDRLIDRDRDGKVSREEAIKGYSAVATLATQNSTPALGFDAKNLVCFGSLEKKDQELFIADSHEKNLLESVSDGNARAVFWGSAQLTVSVLMVLTFFFTNIAVELVRDAARALRGEKSVAMLDEERRIKDQELRQSIQSHSDCKKSPDHCRLIAYEFLGTTNRNPQAALAYLHASCELGNGDACRYIAFAADTLGVSHDLARAYLWTGCSSGQPDSCEEWFSKSRAQETPADLQRLKSLPPDLKTILAIRSLLVDGEKFNLELFISACSSGSSRACEEMQRKMRAQVSPPDPVFNGGMSKKISRAHFEKKLCDYHTKRHQQADLTANFVEGECDGYFISGFWGTSAGIENGAYMTLTGPGPLKCDHKTIGSLMGEACAEGTPPAEFLLVGKNQQTLLLVGTPPDFKFNETVSVSESDLEPPRVSSSQQSPDLCPTQGSAQPHGVNLKEIGKELIIGDELLRPMSVSQSRVGSGFQLVYLRKNSPLTRLGFEARDIIFGINGKRISNREQLFEFAAALVEGAPSCLRWKKGTGEIYQRDFSTM